MNVKGSRLSLIKVLKKRSNDGHVVALFQCKCGKQTTVIVSRVRNGYTRSCGCLGKEQAAAAQTKHGRRYTKEYRTWRGIKDRCTNPNSKDFHRYGGAGITICTEWAESFETFFAYIGRAPMASHQIDRIDTTRGYEPGNVRWADRYTQARNKRSAYEWYIKGQHFPTAAEAAAKHGVSTQTVWRWANGSRTRQGNLVKKREDCHAIPRY